jgi:DNA-binding NarL/FixJ family response regulator
MITILLADDHTVVMDGLRVLLEHEPDLQVQALARDGREAVRLACEIKPDIAILDIAMPELNGIEAAQHIHQDCPGTKTIILSMHANNEYISRAFQAGVLGYLLKESAGSEVVAAVREVHAGRQYLSQKIREKVVGRGALSMQAAPDPLESLSQREREVLLLVVEGHPTNNTAQTLGLSQKTIETYRSRLMRKLHIENIPALVKFAIQHGLTSLGE